MSNTTQLDGLLKSAVDAAVLWAKTGQGYYAMRNRVNDYFEVSTPKDDPSLWYVNNSRKLAMHTLMSKCIMPLKPDELSKLDEEIRDIASDIPSKSLRHTRR